MSSHIAYLDGNAAAGELSRVFAMDVTAAQGKCKHCGAIRRFAEARLYMEGPGVVARSGRPRADLLAIRHDGISVEIYCPHCQPLSGRR
jgi:hypothetical protein